MRVQIPHAKGNGWAAHFAVSCAKTAEPTRTRVGPRNHVLDKVHTGATWRTQLNRLCAAAMRPLCQITLTIDVGILITMFTQDEVLMTNKKYKIHREITADLMVPAHKFCLSYYWQDAGPVHLYFSNRLEGRLLLSLTITSTVLSASTITFDRFAA